MRKYSDKECTYFMHQTLMLQVIRGSYYNIYVFFHLRMCTYGGSMSTDSATLL